MRISDWSSDVCSSDLAVTFSHCVPTILHMLLSHPASKDVDMQGWKIITGGSALPVGLATAAEERGIDIFCGYGMSETGPLSTIAHLAQSGARNANRDIRSEEPSVGTECVSTCQSRW